jgi:hypothetical protein
VAIPDSNPEVNWYSDYQALACTSHLNLLPWYDAKTKGPDPTYPFPAYIKEVLDDRLMIDQRKLWARIRELEPYCNV